MCSSSQVCERGQCHDVGSFYPVSSITTADRPSEPFDKPNSLAVLTDGTVLIAEGPACKVSQWAQRPNGSWEQIDWFGGPGPNLGQMDVPAGITVGNDGRVYVAEWGNHRISIWRRLEGVWTNIDNLDGESVVRFPAGVAVSHDGYLYATEVENHRIAYWHQDSGGNWSAKSLLSGATMSYPDGLSCNSRGELFLANKSQHRITMWATPTSTSPTYFGSGTPGSQAYKFNEPVGVYVHNDDRAYVAELTNNRISVWQRTNGSWSNVGTFGSTATSTAPEWIMRAPHDVWVDSFGYIYVAERDNNRVTVWKQAGF